MEKQKIKENNKFKRKLTIFVCIFLGAVLLFGIIFGAIIGIRTAGYVVKYEGYGIDSGVSAYLVSYCKADYKQYLAASGVSVSDSEEFWNSVSFQEVAARFLKDVVSAAYIFDYYTSLTDEEENEIRLATEEILIYRHSGSKSEFNKACEKYGFDYSDFVKATELLYKWRSVRTRIFGEGGVLIANNREFCDKFLAEYSHVNLIFVRTETTFAKDEAGNYIIEGPDEEGNTYYKLRGLTEAEKAERQRRISELTEVCQRISIDEGLPGDVAPVKFFELQALYDEGDSDMRADGYYFMNGSAYTENFSREFSEVVKKSYEMKIGDASYVETSIGICFIYKSAPEQLAYEGADENGPLSDFYSLASARFFEDMKKEITDYTALTSRWEELSPSKIPYNTEYIARF